MQKVYEKLLAHPLFVSVYVVYYARVARTFILVSLLCVCMCYTIIWIDQIKRYKKTGRRKILLRCIIHKTKRYFLHLFQKSRYKEYNTLCMSALYEKLHAVSLSVY